MTICKLPEFEGMNNCEQAAVWLNKQPTGQVAWDTTDRPDWLLWWLWHAQSGRPQRLQATIKAGTAAALLLEPLISTDDFVNLKLALQTANDFAYNNAVEKDYPDKRFIFYEQFAEINGEKVVLLRITLSRGIHFQVCTEFLSLDLQIQMCNAIRAIEGMPINNSPGKLVMMNKI